MRARIELAYAGGVERRIDVAAPDDAVLWLSVDGEGAGRTVAEWLAGRFPAAVCGARGKYDFGPCVLDAGHNTKWHRQSDGKGWDTPGNERDPEPPAILRDLFAQPSAVRQSVVREDRTPLGPIFTARFDSTCESCGGTLDEGEEARMLDGQAMHRSCAESE